MKRKEDPKPVPYDEQRKERLKRWESEIKHTEGFMGKLKEEKHKWKEVVKSKKKEIKKKIDERRKKRDERKKKENDEKEK